MAKVYKIQGKDGKFWSTSSVGWSPTGTIWKTKKVPENKIQDFVNHTITSNFDNFRNNEPKVIEINN